MDRYDHLRYRKRDTNELLSWRDTLQAMCDYYGTFCGRWHSNKFWKQTKRQIPSMTEEQCMKKIIQIEDEADADLAYWQACQ